MSMAEPRTGNVPRLCNLPSACQIAAPLSETQFGGKTSLSSPCVGELSERKCFDAGGHSVKRPTLPLDTGEMPEYIDSKRLDEKYLILI